MFPPIEYVEWIHGRFAEATHDLGSSDLRPIDGDGSPRVIPRRLRDLPNEAPTASDTERVETLLGARYGVDDDRVCLTAGATHANFLAASTAIGESDSSTPAVVVESPGYEPLTATPRALGARIHRFERPIDEGAPLDPDRVAETLAGVDDCALVTVTNRHNPTGRAVGRETLRAVAEVVSDAGGTLLVDEVYGPYATGTHEKGTPRGVTAAGLPDTIATGSLTKFYGLGGVRVGWLVGPEPMVDRVRTASWHLPVVGEPNRALAARTLRAEATLAGAATELLETNHRLLSTFVDRRDDLDGRIHGGCPFGFVEHVDYDGATLADAAWDEGVLVVPGRFFGEPAGVRVALGRPEAESRAALAAFGDVLDRS
ncbi:pyridoxal phosphate-dependent aminotransferase [Haloferacaceae archaeon DSL9]